MTQIKSKERVRDLAEVYTNEREVNLMLDLIPLNRPDDIINYRYLEPACGNGNFLIEILNRKLKRAFEKSQDRPLVEYERLVAKCVSTIYGIDICEENVKEAKNRLMTQIKSAYDFNKGSYVYSEGFLDSIAYILEKNILVGDSINEPKKIEFTEFKFNKNTVNMATYNLFELMHSKKPTSSKKFPPCKILDLGARSKIKQLELQL